LPWLIAALPAVCGSCDPAISTDSGIVDARGLWIPENTPWSGYFRYLVAQRRDGNVVTAEERRFIKFLAEVVVLNGEDPSRAHPGGIGPSEDVLATAASPWSSC